MHRRLIYTVILVLGFLSSYSQKTKTLSADEIKSYKEECRQMVSFFEGTLNFLGDTSQVISEKEIIINESYLKIFRDPEVQIEDDLDPDRQVPLRKDVQAYLKDVVFFFKTVKFKYDIKSIELQNTNNNQISFKVTANRNLKGITVKNDTLDNNLTRYIEINLDPYNQDLKIVSIYTTLPDMTREMRYWWKTLPDAWKNYFGRRILVLDTLPMNLIESFEDSTVVIKQKIDSIAIDTLITNGLDTLNITLNDTVLPDTLSAENYKLIVKYDTIHKILYDTAKADVSALDFYLKSIFKIKSLDISNHKTIKTLEPVSRLTSLENLNCSNTSVTDLTPVRNLSKLKVLEFSNDSITSLKPLRFCFALKEINASKTQIDTLDILSNLTGINKLLIDSTNVSNISPLSSLKNLTVLSLAYTPVTDLSPLSGMKSLKRLIINNTRVSDISALSGLTSLEYINLDNTNVSDISPLADIKTLKVIQANNTPLNDFDGLGKEQSLNLIYCDNTGIDLKKAMDFMEKNPETLVIFNSERLKKWWENLSPEWKEVFSKYYNINQPPTKEKLHEIVNIKEFSIAGNKKITDLKPVKMLFRLQKLDISNTGISDLSPLAGLGNLRILILKNTPVSTFESLSNITTLQIVDADTTKVSDLLPLKGNKNLEKIYCDNTGVEKANVLEFKKHVPSCLVIYQTPGLEFWWNNIDEEWREVFKNTIGIYDVPTREQLQQIIDLKKLVINNNPDITSLEPLANLDFIETLKVTYTFVSDISPLSELDSLKSLNLSNNPITDITPIGNLFNIEELYLKNTGIDDISPVANLKKLRVLDISGTKVKKLKPLSGLKNLEELIINNTEVRNIKFIMNLDNLNLLKCYNTKINPKKINEFKLKHPDTKVVFY